ncbi:MAG: anthranilate synthase component I family protein, partial [Myxococcota bacterium]
MNTDPSFVPPSLVTSVRRALDALDRQEASFSLPCLVRLHRELIVDTLTALALFDQLRHDHARSFLLESLEGGEQWGRYSFLGLGAVVELVGHADRLDLITQGPQTRSLPIPDGLSRCVETTLAQLPLKLTDQPQPGGRFPGGAVGYISYDLVRAFEPTLGPLPSGGQPLARLVVPEILVRFDQLQQRITILVSVDVEPSQHEGGTPLETLLARGMALLDGVEQRLTHPHPRATLRPVRPEALLPPRAPLPPGELPPGVESTLGRELFMEQVERCKAYIRAGDIIQVVFSQRLSMPLDRTCAPDGDPLTLYRRLRLINPSPYLFVLDLGDEQIIGASPEVMVRKTADRVDVRPIAGTRKRGATPTEDRLLADDLKADAKEVAEHIMLLDLGRNDIGRVSVLGSVVVEEQMVIERYSHVMHLVSHVSGQLRPGLSWRDALAATFPA